jgi:hypothetical protein
MGNADQRAQSFSYVRKVNFGELMHTHKLTHTHAHTQKKSVIVR